VATQTGPPSDVDEQQKTASDQPTALQAVQILRGSKEAA
jgi:hypothetical protein